MAHVCQHAFQRSPNCFCAPRRVVSQTCAAKELARDQRNASGACVAMPCSGKVRGLCHCGCGGRVAC
eukprot:11273928-Alexandrium_andersonii.AAC.1